MLSEAFIYSLQDRIRELAPVMLQDGTIRGGEPEELDLHELEQLEHSVQLIVCETLPEGGPGGGYERPRRALRIVQFIPERVKAQRAEEARKREEEARRQAESVRQRQREQAIRQKAESIRKADEAAAEALRQRETAQIAESYARQAIDEMTSTGELDEQDAKLYRQLLGVTT